MCQANPEYPFLNKQTKTPTKQTKTPTPSPPPPISTLERQTFHFQKENRGKEVKLSVLAIAAAVLLVKGWKTEQKWKDRRTVQISHACVCRAMTGSSLNLGLRSNIFFCFCFSITSSSYHACLLWLNLMLN